MKKYRLGGIAAMLVIAGAIAVNVNLNSRSNMSSIALANVEVLAGESKCRGGSCSVTHPNGRECSICCYIGNASCSYGISAVCLCL
jgi:hypothetical protein